MAHIVVKYESEEMAPAQPGSKVNVKKKVLREAICHSAIPNTRMTLLELYNTEGLQFAQVMLGRVRLIKVEE